MRITPCTRGGGVRLIVLLLILAAVGWHAQGRGLWNWWRYEPREGDLIFQSLPKGDLVRAIEGCTHSPISHCGIVMRDDDGSWVVLEAIGHVRRTPLGSWIRRGRGGRIWLRHPAPTLSVPVFVTAALQYEGRPYDFRYDMNDEEIYCSELIWKAYRDVTGVEMAAPVRLGDLDWKPWTTEIEAIEEGPVPVDRIMVTPVAVYESDCFAN